MLLLFGPALFRLGCVSPWVIKLAAREMQHLAKTVGAVFANVAIYPLFAPNEGDAAGNVVLIAYDGAPRAPDAGELERLAIHPMAKTVARQALRHPLQLPYPLPGAILTDNHNPIDVRDLWLKEWLRGNILAATEFDLLL